MKEEQLIKWINELIRIDRLDKFYHCKYWKRKKEKVQKEFHYECPRCKENKKLTLLSRRDPVHHIKELKTFPQYALSEYFIDVDGKRKRNLIPLCFNCHNEIHNRFNIKKSFINEEKW